jgi:hypothetical protein
MLYDKDFLLKLDKYKTKTIYARINAIESGSEDAETTLKSYTSTML